MGALGHVSVALALLVPAVAIAQADDPLATTAKYLEARQASRCSDVWNFFSAGTQENLRAAVRRGDRSREGPPLGDKPENRECANYGRLIPWSARIVRQQPHEAIVAVKFLSSVLPPAVATQEIKLIREGGAWRVDLPRLPVYSPPGLVEIGPVDVSYQPSGNLGRDKLEATVVRPGSREPLIAVARDPILWARALPSVTSVEPLERVGDTQRVRLAFALILFFNPRQWPANPAEGIFSKERMAEAVSGLGK